MGPEDSSISVCFIDDDVAEITEQPLPSFVSGKYRIVEHVRIRENDVRVTPGPGAIVGIGVAVDHRRSNTGQGGLLPGSPLVIGQGFRGREVERAGIGQHRPSTFHDRGDDGHREGE